MPDDDGPDIIVTGTRYCYDVFEFPSSWLYSGGGSGGGGFLYDTGWDGDGFYSGGGPSEPRPVRPDEAVTLVRIAIDRPLTAAEQRAVEHLLQQIERQTAAIDALPDNATLRLANGSVVTDAELKELWARADFVINDNDHVYANGIDLGESALNGGNPQISFNIGAVVGYDRTPSGMAYVIAHELGYLTVAGQAANNARCPDTEIIANDVARALSNLQGITPMVEPGGGGYTTAASDHFDIPTQVPTPTPSSEPTSDDGGGGSDDNNPFTSGGGGGGGGGIYDHDNGISDSRYPVQLDMSPAEDFLHQVERADAIPLDMEIPIIC